MGSFRLYTITLLLHAGIDAKYLTQDDTSGQRKAGCEIVGAGSRTVDMSSSTACASGTRRCPPCFILNAETNAVLLTVTNCNVDIFDQSWTVSVLSNFQFTNVGTYLSSVSDGYSTYIVNARGLRGSSIECNCYKSGISIHKLSCDASITPVQLTATFANYGNSGLTAAHCITLDTTTIPYGSSNACGHASGCTIDLSDRCNDQFAPTAWCPTCYILNTAAGDVFLTLSKCLYYQGFNMDVSTSVSVEYYFTIVGSNNAKISDGTNIYTMVGQGIGQSSAACWCLSDSGNSRMSCDIPTARTSSQTTGVANFPEALSVKNFVRLGSTLRVNDKVALGSDDTTYMRYNSGVDFYVKVTTASTRSLSMGEGEGILHGVWSSEATVTTSDKRTKKDVEPLRATLQRLRASSRGGWNDENGNVGGESAQKIKTADDSVRWLIEQLRPVSYISKRDESGGRRFGFLADDLMNVLPDSVRVGTDAQRLKRVYLQDFTALLVAAVQNQQRAIEDLERRIPALEHEVARLGRRIDKHCGGSPTEEDADAGIPV